MLKFENINLLTLAAGMGTRTIKRSIVPKPFQLVKGKAIIEWSLTSYQYLINKQIIKPQNLYFVILKKHEIQFNVVERLKKIFGPSIKIIIIPKLTTGPAETALIAAKKINNNNPIIINDSDHYFNGNALYNSITKIKNSKNISGIINTTKTNSKKPVWSYVKKNKKGKLLGVKEKNLELARKNAPGVIGSYFFSSTKLFIKSAKELIIKNRKLKREFFISNILDALIKKKRLFEVCQTKKIYPLGNYEQINKFEKKFNFKNFYPEPKTIIIDFDGVLVKHDNAGGVKSNKKIFTYPTTGILKNIGLVNKEYEEGSFVVVMSARPVKEKNKIKNELTKHMINYHELVLGVASGSRIVINDKKKSHPNIKTAIALEIKRNTSIKKL